MYSSVAGQIESEAIERARNRKEFLTVASIEVGYRNDSKNGTVKVSHKHRTDTVEPLAQANEIINVSHIERYVPF